MCIEMIVAKAEQFERKVAILKQYEIFGYQVAYYILENETRAAEASAEALKEIFRDEQFFYLTQPQQEQRTKQICMKHCLSIIKNCQSCAVKEVML